MSLRVRRCVIYLRLQSRIREAGGLSCSHVEGDWACAVRRVERLLSPEVLNDVAGVDRGRATEAAQEGHRESGIICLVWLQEGR